MLRTDSARAASRKIKRIVPHRQRELLRRLYFTVRTLAYRGDGVVCVCCGGHFRKFAQFGVRPRSGAQCPRCGSLERHRGLMLFVQSEINLSAPLRLLHVAPEPMLQRYFRSRPEIDYVSGDLHSPLATVKLDVTAIPFADSSFDAIICNHVLEHVRDDARAMRELRRVCKPGSWAILQAPVDPSLEHTLEDPAVRSPAARRRLYGQEDHVRSYGRDYATRLRMAGWKVIEVDIAGRLGPDAARDHGLTSTHDRYIYLCTNPTAAIP